MSKNYYVISEYGYIASKKNLNFVDKGSALVEDKVFNELESFILKNKETFENAQAGEFLSIGYKNGIGKIIKAQNYVGLIQTKSGTTIEILPKIYNGHGELSYEKTLKIFLRMLKYLKDTPFKEFNLSSVNVNSMNLLDVFINMFLEELGLLLKKGIKSKYIAEEDNLFYFKGKLNVNNHIKYNFVNKERFYVNYDKYSQDRPENKLIKSTLLYLKAKTNKSSLQNLIRKYLFILDEITPSQNIENDFAKCSNNRLMSDYDTILNWCKIFLAHKSFMNFKGDSIAYSLLFPMEKVFESYVAKMIKKHDAFKNFNVYTQHSKFYLLEKPKMFKLRPDIVIEMPNKIVILDTKWKLLKNDANVNYGISQSDLYQMYAYAQKYKANNIILLYPQNGYGPNEMKNISMIFEENIHLNVFFVDLEKTEESIESLASLVSEDMREDMYY